MIFRNVHVNSVASVLAAFALFGTSGCTTLGNLATPAANPLIQVAVDVAVAAAVGNNPILSKVKAQTIYTVASQLLALDTGDNVAITAIEAAANAKIAALTLPPADKVAAQVLVQTIEALILQKLGSSGTTTTAAGTVKSDTKVALALVLNDVKAACALYGAA